jgi:hypothetical protein
MSWLTANEYNYKKIVVAKNMALVPQPPYLPDFAPCELLLFPRKESQL